MLSHKSRIEQLNRLLQYDSENTKVFTRGERVCINQERGHLLSLKTPFSTVNKAFEYSDSLKYKINNTIKEIYSTEWEPYKEIYINWATDKL